MIFVDLITGDRLAIAINYIVSIRKMNHGCEIQMSSGLLFQVDDSFNGLSELIATKLNAAS